MLKFVTSLLSAVLVLIGLYLFAFGDTWASAVLEFLPDTKAGMWIELVVPFIPMVFIACGAVLFASRRS
jgi:hypothetical protein